MRLLARFDSTCDFLRGELRAKRRPAKAFTARRSRCGDGTIVYARRPVSLTAAAERYGAPWTREGAASILAAPRRVSLTPSPWLGGSP